ncbi:ADP-ribose glycohydrolase OARD1 isoform X2 [Drosophila yakuba]|uniref:Uncharacterized protein, isoform B n=1 Tax=Drosophila yakuba TaxID=7245 RepID=A0A0R1EDI3_DROYA|nr:ADP-ribose glycohydrolase OARD1 isoform X2 [Drosophila yakuba]KRK05194.1 uncharacterized protein Dyak_GE22958, isoform B [Drosophila yakuba]
MANVKIVESKLDIFHAPQTHSLAHAVESSFTAERGTLAWQFALIYGDVDELRQRRVSRGNCAVLEHNARFIYYLVTKSSLYEASTYDDVQSALICMREHMREHGVTKLAIPRLGCGIDRLDWLRVRSLLDLVFAEDSVDIIAFFYTPPQMVKDTLNVVCPTCRHMKTIHLPSRSVSGSRSSLHREKTPF